MQKRIALLGDGYPGALLLYPESPELRGQMSKYGLTAGYFQRSEQEDGIRQSFSRMFPTNSLPALPPRGTVAWVRGVGARCGCAAWGARGRGGGVGARWGGAVATGLKTRDSSGNGFSLTFFSVAARIGYVFGVETVSGRWFRRGFPCSFIILLRFVFSANGVTRHGYQYEFRERA